jgi:hypothetical protein
LDLIRKPWKTRKSPGVKKKDFFKLKDKELGTEPRLEERENPKIWSCVATLLNAKVLPLGAELLRCHENVVFSFDS